MAAEDLIPALQTAVGSFNTTVDGKQSVVDGKVASGSTAKGNATTALTSAKAARDTAEQSLKAAYTDTQSAKSSVDYQDLAALAAEKAVTAVDVFVYDTSKDSDGGAWRKRCSKLSWYNEPLNTATRGSRREFPSVAVIVAAANYITVYDGDDPALPMWMVFQANGASYHWYAVSSVAQHGNTFNYSPSYGPGLQSCNMLNAKLTIGNNYGLNSYNRWDGLYEIDFLSDTSILRNTGGWRRNATIAERNVSKTPAYDIDNTVSSIVGRPVYDVAMTVLPDAPVDPATGLPVPTIAVATNSGVSVIKDDGTIADSASTNTVYRVLFADQNLVWCPTSTPQNWFLTFNVGDLQDGFSYDEYLRREDTSIGDYPRGPQATSANTRHEYLGGGVFATSNTIATAPYSSGVFLYQRGEVVTPSKNKGMIAKIQSGFNTGWMNGDIKGAFLAATDATDLTDAELVTNGTFDTDTSGWSAPNGATLSVDAGRLKVTSNGGGWEYALQTFSVVAGAAYRVSVTGQNGNVTPFLYLGSSIGAYDYAYTTLPNGVEKEFFIVAKSSTLSIRLNPYATTSGDYAFFDNVSVKLADADRSTNFKGLIVNGTVARSPVATGAELVAYSGFSATGSESTSSFLKQPYNPDLNFGTGEFAIIWWENKSVAATRYQMDRRGSTNTGKWTVYSNSDNKLVFLAYDQLGTIIGGSKVATNASPINTWVMNAIVRDASGTLHFYLNASNNGSHAFSGDITDTNADAVLDVGNRWDHANAWSGSLALLRISATAPTAEQIKKIYEDEKVLFQENAACTLYGTSDAVTALAHDEDTGLLHVGTSAGRSVFKGLRRVSNTTTAVGTAISAVNGMVVEE